VDTGKRRPESVLVALAQEGDHKAFEELMEPYWDRIHAFALRRLKDKDLADEAIQKTCIVVKKAIVNYEGRSSLFVWLCGVTRNVLRRMRREEKCYMKDLCVHVYGAHIRESIENDSPFDNVSYIELSGYISDAVASLSVSSREVLFAKVHGVSGKEIAMEKGITKDAVRARTYRARKEVLPHLLKCGWARGR
tara:strand:- start:1784 stop:2362 length:579 start_codon:yes stop_codon:yes gene_type:complete